MLINQTRTIRYSFICLLLLGLFLSGCGGGGGSTVIPGNPVSPTITPFPTATATPATATGSIVDIFSGQAQANCQVSINGNSVLADANGNFNAPIAAAQESWSNVIVSSDNIVTRNFYSQNLSGIQIKTIAADYNMTMFRAYQWKGSNESTVFFDPQTFPVKFILYRYTDEGNLVDDKTWAYMQKSAQNFITNCIPGVIEIYDVGRPDSDPRFDKVPVMGSTTSYYGYAIIDGQPTMAVTVCEKYGELTTYAGGGACRFDQYNRINQSIVVLSPYQAVWNMYPDLSESVMNEYFQMVTDHETGHGCGLEHPHENMAENLWPDFLETSIMNYNEICGQGSNTLTQTDLNTFKILNDRGYGNSAPDTNPQPPEIGASELILTELFQH